MSRNNNKKIRSFLLEAPRQPEHVAHWSSGEKTPIHTLRRQPVNLHEILQCKKKVVMDWREDETLVYVTPPTSHDRPPYNQRCLLFDYGNDKSSVPRLYIVGKTDDAIAKTAAYFMALEEPWQHQKSSTLLRIQGMHSYPVLNLSAARTHSLQHMLEAIPSRTIHFVNVQLRPEQSKILATRRHRISLILSRCLLEDGGMTFVNALHKRSTPFGSLTFTESDDEVTPYSWKFNAFSCVIQATTIDTLRLPQLNDISASIPFWREAGSLHYEITTMTLMKLGIPSLLIFIDKLALTIYHNDDDDDDDNDGDTFPTECMLLFWRRVMELSHFKELQIRVKLSASDTVIAAPKSVVQEMIYAVQANRDLQIWDVCDRESSEVDWDLHMGTILEGIEDHPGLHSKLITHNQQIVVKDDVGNILSNGRVMDELYSLNHFYRGSKVLAKPPFMQKQLRVERPSFVATALMLLRNFQRTALLLSDHTDVLCELLQHAIMDGDDDTTSPPSSRNWIWQRTKQWLGRARK